MLNGYKLYLYKRGVGFVKEVWWPNCLFRAIEKCLIGKYDGVIVAELDGKVKAMYGYCGI